jgi:hypothetical protein
MRRGHLNAEEPLGPLGETHSVGRRKCLTLRCRIFMLTTHILATPPQHHPHHPSHIGARRPIPTAPWTIGHRSRCSTLTLTSIPTSNFEYIGLHTFYAVCDVIT